MNLALQWASSNLVGLTTNTNVGSAVLNEVWSGNQKLLVLAAGARKAEGVEKNWNKIHDY